MIRVEDRPLARATAERLSAWQAELDAVDDYERRVEAALEAYRLRSRTKVFEDVRSTLRSMCSGLERCGYCEDGPAHHIEHIWPKSRYPERTFVWLNLLFCCGDCNERKNDRFAVIRDGTLHELPRQTKGRRTPPPQGQPAIVDPRREDPLEFLELDLVDTFFVEPRVGLDERSRLRARYTIDVLQLNRREVLVEGRRDALRDYELRVQDYASLGPRAPQGQRERLLREIARLRHRMVWEEMKRSPDLVEGLRSCLESAPELASI